jgi:peptide/nickel transport system permease protein
MSAASDAPAARIPDRSGAATSGAGPAPAAPPPRVGRSRLELLARSPTFAIGAGIILFWVFCAIFGHQIAPYSPYADDLLNAFMPPSAKNWFGTDSLGRDVFSRVITGARDILVVAPAATLLGTVLGAALGLVMGTYGGLVDHVLSRLIEAFLSIPLIIVALLALVALGSSNLTVIMVIGLSFTPIIARTVRAAVLSERELDYVTAARLRRENSLYVMFVEILPNITGPIIVEMTIRLGYAIFAVATLSFIGFGIQIPSPDWGLSIATNYGQIIGGYWWMVLFDAIAIASLVVAVNFVAEAIQGVFNA